MRSIGMAAVALWIAAAGAQGQNDLALRTGLEGRVVTVKMDMPATSQGVEVFPQDAMPVDVRQVAERIKEHGAALRMGQQVMISKVVVKGRSHIEVQLGGGGYGTFGDWVSSPSSATAVEAGENREERALREQIRGTTDRNEKRRLERELEALRSARQRENARAAAEAQQANEAREANLRTRRLESGSRFNLRYRNGIPADVQTPEGVMRALAQFLEFTAPVGVATAPPAPAEAAAKPRPAGLAGLKKGLALEEVEGLLGPAVAAGEARQGSLTVTKRTYRCDGMKVAASFVSGVLIDFAITPQ